MIHITEDKLKAAIQICLVSDSIYTKERESNLVHDIKALSVADVIANGEFQKDLKKAIEEGNEVGYNADGGYNYYCEETALREVLKVINKHLL